MVYMFFSDEYILWSFIKIVLCLDEILSGAADEDVAFLVVGDPLGYGSCFFPINCCCFSNDRFTKYTFS